MSKVSGTFDQVIPMDIMTREKAQEYTENEAHKRAVKKRADEHTLEVIDVVEVPLVPLSQSCWRFIGDQFS